MLDNIKDLLTFKTIDKNIANGEFEVALQKLNSLIKKDFRPAETYLKRGILCTKLLMYGDAYSDFTYIIGHCTNKVNAYKARMLLNFEISNYKEAISDAQNLLSMYETHSDINKIIFLSLVYSEQTQAAQEYILSKIENKYKAMQLIFNEVARLVSSDDFAKALKLLSIIDLIDKDNPIKLLKEAHIYAIAGDKDTQDKLLKKIDDIFPKYFVSHFRFVDIYEQHDLSEISFLLELAVFDTQGLFLYPLKVLEGYKNHIEGHIIDAKECFEKAVAINPHKPNAYVLLAQTLQLMSGYDNPEYKKLAEENYKKALDIYTDGGFLQKAEDMRKQLRHLESNLSLR